MEARLFICGELTVLLEQALDALPGLLLGDGDGLAGEDAVVGVDSFGEAWVFEYGGFGADPGEPHDVREGGIGEGQRGGVGHGGGHICDAVVDDAVELVGGIAVGGRARGFNAAALVNGDVDDDGTFLHGGDHVAGDDFGRCRAGNENAADDEVGLADCAGYVVGVGGEGVEATAEDIVELAEAVEAEVDEGDLGAHAESDFGGVGADDAATDDADVGWRDAGNSTEQETAAAAFLFEVGCADLHGHAPGYL